jgi:hypothetical protein
MSPSIIVSATLAFKKCIHPLWQFKKVDFHVIVFKPASAICKIKPCLYVLSYTCSFFYSDMVSMKSFFCLDSAYLLSIKVALEHAELVLAVNINPDNLDFLLMPYPVFP